MGRNDGQVQIRGYRVELGEIENIICRHFNIQEVVIVAHSVVNNTTLHLFMLASDAVRIKFNEIKNVLKNVLPVYMLPNEVHVIDEWIVTPSQKIDRKALKEKYILNVSANHSVENDEMNDYAVHLLTEIAETLGIKFGSISLSDDFFEIGGNSLSLTTLVLRLN